MNQTLFIGNFLSRKRGTKGVIERLADHRNEFAGTTLILKSYFLSKPLRFVDILLAVSFARYQLIFIDVYSGLYFRIVRVASWIAQLRNKKIILTFHGGKLHELERQKPALFATVIARGTKLITPSHFLIHELAKAGYTLTYLPNFLELERFTYARSEHLQFKILWVRAFASIYNPHMAIRVLHEVIKHVPQATLTLVGPDHGELSSCRELINSLNLRQSVTITGKAENNKLPEFYHTHQVFLNTTWYESFGVAVLEAASCGIPVVSNRVGEIPYLWKEGEEMLLCEAGDDKEMAGMVVQLLQNPAMATSLSLRARTKAEQFSWEAVKPQWQKLMQGHE